MIDILELINQGEIDVATDYFDSSCELLINHGEPGIFLIGCSAFSDQGLSSSGGGTNWPDNNGSLSSWTGRARIGSLMLESTSGYTIISWDHNSLSGTNTSRTSG